MQNNNLYLFDVIHVELIEWSAKQNDQRTTGPDLKTHLNKTWIRR